MNLLGLENNKETVGQVHRVTHNLPGGRKLIYDMLTTWNVITQEPEYLAINLVKKWGAFWVGVDFGYNDDRFSDATAKRLEVVETGQRYLYFIPPFIQGSVKLLKPVIEGGKVKLDVAAEGIYFPSNCVCLVTNVVCGNDGTPTVADLGQAYTLNYPACFRQRRLVLAYQGTWDKHQPAVDKVTRKIADAKRSNNWGQLTEFNRF